MRNTYRKVAKKHGVSAKEVKEEMRKALDHAYINTPNNAVAIACQNQVPSNA